MGKELALVALCARFPDDTVVEPGCDRNAGPTASAAHTVTVRRAALCASPHALCLPDLSQVVQRQDQ